MSECDEFRELTPEHDPAEEARLQKHAAGCPSCHEQLATDRELRQVFQGIPRPGPSLHFNRVLRQRLRAERELERRSKWSLLVMQGYWVAAAVASGAVLMLIRWPSELPSEPLLWSLGAVSGTALFALLVLYRSLRIGPIDLILNTVKVLRG